MGFIEAIGTNPLLQAALLTGLASSILSGVIGSYVVIKRIVFISGSIAHAVLGGIGFSLWLQRVHHVSYATPLFGSLGAALVSALLIGLVHLRFRQREDAVIAAIWSIGMAIGVLFISQTPGYNVELTNYLIGNILWVSPSDLRILWGLDITALTIVFLLQKQFQLICFDEDQARLQRLPVNRLYLLLLILIAVSVVLLVQVVGIILVIAMLTIPPTIANLISNRLHWVMGLAVLISSTFSLGGIFIAYELDWPIGATIALLAGFTYLLALIGFRRKI